MKTDNQNEISIEINFSTPRKSFNLKLDAKRRWAIAVIIIIVKLLHTHFSSV